MERKIVGILLFIAGVVVYAGVIRGWWDWLDLEEIWSLGVSAGLMILGGWLALLRRGRRGSRR